MSYRLGTGLSLAVVHAWRNHSRRSVTIHLSRKFQFSTWNFGADSIYLHNIDAVRCKPMSLQFQCGSKHRLDGSFNSGIESWIQFTSIHINSHQLARLFLSWPTIASTLGRQPTQKRDNCIASSHFRWLSQDPRCVFFGFFFDRQYSHSRSVASPRNLPSVFKFNCNRTPASSGNVLRIALRFENQTRSLCQFTWSSRRPRIRVDKNQTFVISWPGPDPQYKTISQALHKTISQALAKPHL